MKEGSSGGSSMKRVIALAALVCLAGAGTLVDQEHWTEGPVWNITFYRANPGHSDDHMKYLPAHYILTTAESKKQGLILDSKIYVKQPHSPTDWDVAIATLYPSYGKALDASPGRTFASEGSPWT
jgi:hypothetical protein